LGRSSRPAKSPIFWIATEGNFQLWMSRDEGRLWECLARHLPEIYAVEAAELA
jgi:hypothetical protein